MVAIEAMAMKTPIIASRVGGLKEVVKEGISGLLFEVNDETELTNKLISLIDNSKLREEMGEEGYNLVLNNFKVEDMVDKIEKSYLQLTQ
jgi:glycosyltransferase involved in cell wall biosynthesis